MECLIVHLAHNCGNKGESALGCRLHVAAALVKVLYGRAGVLRSCSAFKFESHFMDKDVHATRDQRHRTDMVALQNEV